MSDCSHDSKKIQELSDIANKLRVHSITSTNSAKSGHVTSCCSCAEIMSVLFFHSMRYDPKTPRDPNSDRFIMSKGHAAPILYAAWTENGFLPEGAIQNLRKLDCTLEGHPTPRLEFVDVATGSLGQGLSCACGIAYTGKYFDKASYRVYCLIGDGESAEGSVWEAAHFASLYKLNNLVAIFDVNRLGQSEPTSMQHHVEQYQDRMRAFGWNSVVVDGHDVSALVKAFHDAELVTDRPTAIIAKTFKGKGLPGVEDLNDWHGKPLGDKAKEILPLVQAQIKNSGPHGLIPQPPKKDAREVHIDFAKIKLSSPPAYKKGDMVATRVAYGTGLLKLGQACEHVVALDGDVKNSTFADKFQKAFPERFIQCYIAEQNLVGVSIGCGTRGRTIPFCSTFACFFSRAADQLRMGAISQANIKCCGSHVGVSIGEDGPSQMALEDLAMFRSINGSTVFYPSDAVSCERAVELAAKTPGICFIRTGRPNQPVIYANEEEFHVGQAKVVVRNDADKALIVGAGVTLTEAMKAAEKLAGENIHVCVIDPFTIKPLDSKTIIEQAKRVGGRVVIVEDHYPEGGLGEAVSTVLAGVPNLHVKHLAVTSLPMSGPPDVLMDRFNISARAIVEAVKSLNH